MPSPRKGRPFVPRAAGPVSAQGPGPRRDSGKTKTISSGQRGGQVIPERVANRMARRVALATGIPTVMGMAVFVGSYLLVSRKILDIPPSATLLASGGCFLLGLIGLSYGVLSASWEDAPGTMLGTEQIGLNISRIRASLEAMRRGSASG